MSRLIFLSLLCVSAFSAQAVTNLGVALPCKMDTWKLSPGLSLRQIKDELEKLPRHRVIQLAWGEMSRKDLANSMAIPLLQYLAGTEQNVALRGYFKALLVSVLKPDSSAREALKTWPVRPAGARVSAFTLPQLCSLYESAK